MTPNTSGPTSPQSVSAQPTLLRELNWVDTTALVAGCVIGSGIFLVPGSVAGQLTSFGEVMLVWLVGGVLTVFGALSLAELGAAYHGSGGLYIYLREAYGRPLAFLYGWGELAMIHSGSVATLAAGFSLYVAQLIPMGVVGQKAVGIACIAVLTFVNCIGVRSGKLVQNIFTIAKLGGLAAMIVLLLARGRPMEALSGELLPNGLPGIAPFGIALVAVLWAYEAWHQVSFAAGEIKDPSRDLPRGLAAGTIVVVFAYLLANLAYYSVLSPEAIRQSPAVAAAALTEAYGPAATTFISVLILVSIFGSTNGAVLCGPRVYYAMAAEGLFFRAFGRVHPQWRTPVFAIVVQGVWASALTLMGNFQQLFTYVIFTAWIFYGLCVAGVIVLRLRHPNMPRPFKVPGYPLTPALFSLAALGLTINTLVTDTRNALFGISFILAGIPLYYFFRRKA